MNIIANKRIFLGFSAALVIAAGAALAVFGLKQGIDFVGGVLWQIRIVSVGAPAAPAAKMAVAAADIERALRNEAKAADAAVTAAQPNLTAAGDNRFLIRFKELSEADHQRFLKTLTDRFGRVEELSYESIGSSIGGELRRKSLWAFVLALAAISLYIAFVFRGVSRPVSSWKYGIITLLTLFHDAVIPTGLFAYLGYAAGAEIGVNFIVAILVVIGFSVHDTIVVFDRIRENLQLERSGAPHFADVVNRSIRQTFARSINTSLTLVLVLAALLVWGAEPLRLFILVILVGTVIGTYSSIFVASPLLVLWKPRR